MAIDKASARRRPEIPQPRLVIRSEIAEAIPLPRRHESGLFMFINRMRLHAGVLRQAKTREIRSEQRFSRAFDAVLLRCRNEAFATAGPSALAGRPTRLHAEAGRKARTG
jgi:hypothetical protein